MNILLLSRKIDIIKDILPEKSKIGFIKAAGEVYENPIWIKEDKDLLLQYGYKIIDIDITKNSTNQSIIKINEVDCLYIAGGNVFYLKQQIEQKNLKEVIENFINSNKLYVGTSAGGALCCPTLEPYKTLDDPKKAKKLNDTTGLNLIDFVVLPHYEREKYLSRHNDIINKYNKKYKLLTLKDNQALLFKEKDQYKLYEF